MNYISIILAMHQWLNVNFTNCICMLSVVLLLPCDCWCPALCLVSGTHISSSITVMYCLISEIKLIAMLHSITINGPVHRI